jgi:hypothetical protein
MHRAADEGPTMIDHHGIRRFTDEHGVEWEVWEAHPRLAERRRLRERRKRHRDEVHERRIALTDERPSAIEQAGWLVFKSEVEERRRTPIPTEWEGLPDHLLAGLLRQSRATGPFPRVRQ